MPGATGGNTITSTNQIANDVIVNADVNPAAAIDASKIAGDVETTGAQSIDGVKTFTSAPLIPDEAYSASWDSKLEPPTKNAVYDKFNSLSSAILEQVLNIYVGTGTDSAGTRVGGDKASGLLIVQESNAAKMMRFIKDSVTQQYKLTNVVADSNSGLGQPWIHNGYVYKAHFGGSQKLYRYDLADLANEVQITYSGGTPDGHCGFSDGTYLYVAHSGGVFKKYTVSGTTATYVADVTFTSAGTVISVAYDGGNVYTMINPTSGVSTVKKYPVAGGAATATLTLMNYNDGDIAYSPNSLFVPATGVLGVGYGYQSKNGATVLGTKVKLTAITLP